MVHEAMLALGVDLQQPYRGIVWIVREVLVRPIPVGACTRCCKGTCSRPARSIATKTLIIWYGQVETSCQKRTQHIKRGWCTPRALRRRRPLLHMLFVVAVCW
jgi:hypothetical protein